MYQAVTIPTVTIKPANSTVLHRKIRTFPGSVKFPASRGMMKSCEKLVARAFKAVLSDPMVAAKIPATTNPRKPTGITCKMK